MKQTRQQVCNSGPEVRVALIATCSMKTGFMAQQLADLIRIQTALLQKEAWKMKAISTLDIENPTRRNFVYGFLVPITKLGLKYTVSLAGPIRNTLTQARGL